MDCFGRASNAKEEMTKKTAMEKINLKITTAQMKGYAETQTMPTLQYIANELCEDDDIEYVTLKERNQASLEKIEVGEANSILTKLKEYPYEFEIDSDLKLASINGIKLAANTVSKEEYDRLVSLVETLSQEVTNLKNSQNTETNSSDGNPIGTIIAYSANSVPQGGYLKCEGQSISRTEYSDLFNVIGTTYGFDDSTTFKVPDLRGEFLRGTGTNSHANQGNGATVGTHQNATEIPAMGSLYDATTSKIHFFNKASTSKNATEMSNIDKAIKSNTATYHYPDVDPSNTNEDNYAFTIRPTNTSVLYCIKY